MRAKNPVNRMKCKSYKELKTKDKNKRRKLEKHMKKYPKDTQAANALENL